MGECRCPKCGTETVVDENGCFERCLSCGWFDKIEEGK